MVHLNEAVVLPEDEGFASKQRSTDDDGNQILPNEHVDGNLANSENKNEEGKNSPVETNNSEVLEEYFQEKSALEAYVVEEADDDEIIHMPKKTKHILDSDDDESDASIGEKRQGSSQNSINPKLGSFINIDSGSITKRQEAPKRISAVIDSDSEEDLPRSINTEENSKNKSKLCGLKDTNNNEEKEKKHCSKVFTNLKQKKKSKQTDNESKSTKISSLVDSDSSMESNDSSDEDRRESSQESNHEERENYSEQKKKATKPMRASAKKAIDEMQAIQSEQQRLHREAYISIPYHKPKRHTLQEFLKRRTIQISLQKNDCLKRTMNRVKMTAEELEEYAKLMDERAKEATEFFKSESEDEELKDNDFDMINNTENSKIAPPQNGSDEEQNTKPNKLETANENVPYPNINTSNKAQSSEEISTSQPMVTEVAELPKLTLDTLKIAPSTAAEEDFHLVQEKQTPMSPSMKDDTNMSIDLDTGDLMTENCEDISTSQPIVTEVVELPKLNLDTLKMAPPSAAEKVFRLIREKQLPMSPSLRGDSNMLIDLETGDLVAKQPSGVDNLLKRFMEAKIQRRPKSSNTVSILSTDNGKLEISTINLHVTEEPVPQKEPKPRAAYFKLKENLRTIIAQKRREEFEKKITENQEKELESDKCLNGEDDEDEVEDVEENNYLIDEEENPVDVIVPNRQNSSPFNEENTIQPNLKSDDIKLAEGLQDQNGGKLEYVSDDDANEESNDGEYKIENNDDHDEENDDDINDIDKADDALKTCDQDHNTSKTRNRIIKVFEEEDSDEDNDFLRPFSPKGNAILEVCDKETRNQIEEENELMQLCSGNFTETQQATEKNFISQIPITQINPSGNQTDLDNELLELCSGTFETQQDVTSARNTVCTALNSSTFVKKIISSDEENSGDVKRNRVKKFTKRVKKNKMKLGFSDDEDGEETSATSDGNESMGNDLEDEPATLVDYDSEENEIIVKMTKQECMKKAGEYFENEAELSESDWGSADEDERNLDKYDIELGDEDEFDREKLRTELGQIHARKMLDEDIREVRKLQEMFFEDEENDGVGRQRQFRWKNIESGFKLNDSNVDAENGEKPESDEEENEQLWRTTRYEREQILKEQNIQADISKISQSETLHGSTSQATMSAGKKVNIITAKKTISTEDKNSSPFLIMKSMKVKDKTPFRGSFLVRDDETLNKLAGLTKGAVIDVGAEAGSTVSIKELKPKNFVFATLTAEEHANLKRKSSDILNSSTETGINYMKKPRMEHRRNKCLIDQLL